jgi:glycosyltransferase involved in cell wall biosynthesis
MKTLIVYHYVALYREPIFKELVNKSDCHVACDYKSNNDIETVAINSEFYKKNFSKLDNKWLFKSLLWQRNLLNLILSRKYDKVIFLGDPHFISTWFAIFLNKIIGIKSYLWTHGFLNRSGKFLESIKIFMYGMCDGLLLYSHGAKNDLIKAGIESAKIHVIYNSLDYERHKIYREALSSNDITKCKKNLFKNPNLLQLMFIGRITKQKKLDMLVKALVSLHGSGQKVNLLIIGDGSQKASLEKLVSDNSLNDYVCFYGKSYGEKELAPLIMSSDVCVSPGEIGLTAMHSLGYGTPVITHNDRNKQMPEFEAVISNETGVLFNEGSLESLVESITNYQQLDLIALRANSIAIIEKNYTPQAQFKLIEKAIGV